MTVVKMTSTISTEPTVGSSGGEVATALRRSRHVARRPARVTVRASHRLCDRASRFSGLSA